MGLASADGLALGKPWCHRSSAGLRLSLAVILLEMMRNAESYMRWTGRCRWFWACARSNDWRAESLQSCRCLHDFVGVCEKLSRKPQKILNASWVEHRNSASYLQITNISGHPLPGGRRFRALYEAFTAGVFQAVAAPTCSPGRPPSWIGHSIPGHPGFPGLLGGVRFIFGDMGLDMYTDCLTFLFFFFI